MGMDVTPIDGGPASAEVRRLLLDEEQYDTEVSWNGSRWPARHITGADGLVVDLRLRDPQDQTRRKLVFLPELLARCGVPDEVILAAAGNTPAGFILLD